MKIELSGLVLQSQHLRRKKHGHPLSNRVGSPLIFVYENESTCIPRLLPIAGIRHLPE
jgi:hypothetical protein